MTKEHFYLSRTGSIFVLTKIGNSWYLAGNPVISESKMLWPVGASVNFKKISSYVKKQLGFYELR